MRAACAIFVGAMFTLTGCAGGSTPSAPAKPTQSSTIPPVTLNNSFNDAALPDAPDGFAWQKIEPIDVAVLTPIGWKEHQRDIGYSRIFAFSDEPLDAKGFFETGLTVKLLWHPYFMPGTEEKAVDDLLVGIAKGIKNNTADNTVIRGTREVQYGKPMLVVRYRNAPKGMTPIIVHTVAIGDPQTGLVYQFIFEGPESRWEKIWEIGDQIMSRLIILFPTR
jgi:hypothetical protein